MRRIAPLCGVLLSIFFAAGSGCVHFSALPSIPYAASGDRAVWQEQAGLAVHVRAFPNEDVELEQIGRPARSQGFLPLVLCFENLGDHAFRGHHAAVALITPSGREYQAASAEEAFAALRYSQGGALWGLPLGVFPALLLSDQIEEENQRFLEDLRGKLLDEWTLSANEKSVRVLALFPVGARRAQKIAPEECLVRIVVAHDVPNRGQQHRLEYLLVPALPAE